MPPSKPGHSRIALIADSLEGGAGRAALRLFEALMALGVDVDLVHFYGECRHPRAICLDGRAKRPPIERALKNLSRPAADQLRRKRHRAALGVALAQGHYDLLHLHNLHACGLATEDLPALAAGRPVLWTLHDEFALRGRPFPVEGETLPPVSEALFDIPGLAMVAPSQWLGRSAEVALQGRIPVTHCPYGLHESTFTVLDQAECRQVLKLDPDALWIGFAGGNDMRKGGDCLLAASRIFGAEREVKLLAWGRPLPEGVHGFREVRQLSYARDDATLNRMYAACDLMLVPSREDNFPLVVLESLASGTPVAASDQGGSAEALAVGDCGLSIPLASEAMAQALMPVFDRARLGAMRLPARARFTQAYRSELEARRILGLYERMTGMTPLKS